MDGGQVALCCVVLAVATWVYDWCVAFAWSFGIGRDLSTPTSWAPTEQWPGERHLCFPSYRDYKTRQRALWIAEALQSTIGPDYMNTVWRFKVWLSLKRVPLSTPREQWGTIELQSERECLACLAPSTVSTAIFVPCFHAPMPLAHWLLVCLNGLTARYRIRAAQVLVRDPCGHASLCSTCRNSWLQRTPCCPICRESFVVH